MQSEQPDKADKENEDDKNEASMHFLFRMGIRGSELE